MRAKTSQTKDTVIYSFKNGSTLENIAVQEGEQVVVSDMSKYKGKEKLKVK